MREPRKQDGGRRRRRRGLDRAVAGVLALLPLLVGAGLLLPGFVRVRAQAEEPAATLGPPPARSPLRLPRAPLLVPYDFSVAFTPEVVDLDHLFFRTRHDASVAAGQARRFAFPRSHGDVIVLDDLARGLPEFVFPESIVARALSQPGPDFPTRGFGGFIGISSSGSGGVIDTPPFDPSQGSGGTPSNVIPEPGTGLLVALGLALASAWRRRYRQPTTS